MKAQIALLLCVVTGAVGWWVGNMGTEPDPIEGPGSTSVEELRAENARLRAELEGRGPGLSAVGPREIDATGGRDPEDPAGTGTTGGGKAAPVPFSLEGVNDPAFAVKKFQAYVLEEWARGKEGHLALVKTLNELMESRDLMKQLFPSEEEAIRHLYPMIKFLTANDQQVADMTETIFETMAKDPQSFSDVDDDVLEMFTDDGAGIFMPAIMSEKRLEKMRGYAKTILETPEDRQSEAIRKSRRDIERVLRAWAPPITPEEALAALRAGNVSPADLRRFIQKVKPADFASLDIVATLGPLVAAGDYAGIGLLHRIPLDTRTLDGLDAQLIEGVAKGQVRQWVISQYLRNTKRTKWTQYRGLVESGFERGGKAAETFAYALLQLPERPGKDWVAWALGRYDIPEHQVTSLKAAFKIN